jgi:hypothetical protein
MAPCGPVDEADCRRDVGVDGRQGVAAAETIGHDANLRRKKIEPLG